MRITNFDKIYLSTPPPQKLPNPLPTYLPTSLPLPEEEQMINHPLTKLGTKDSKIVQNLVHEIVQKNGPKNSPMVQSIFYPMPVPSTWTSCNRESSKNKLHFYLFVSVYGLWMYRITNGSDEFGVGVPSIYTVYPNSFEMVVFNENVILPCC